MNILIMNSSICEGPCVYIDYKKGNIATYATVTIKQKFSSLKIICLFFSFYLKKKAMKTDSVKRLKAQ